MVLLWLWREPRSIRDQLEIQSFWTIKGLCQITITVLILLPKFLSWHIFNIIRSLIKDGEDVDVLRSPALARNNMNSNFCCWISNAKLENHWITFVKLYLSCITFYFIFLLHCNKPSFESTVDDCTYCHSPVRKISSFTAL